MTRRTRAVAMLGAAVACAGFSVSAVRHEGERVRAQVGEPTSVVVAARAVPRGTLITPARTAERLVERKVPARFVPPSAIRSTGAVAGLRTVVPLAVGDYLTEGQLAAPKRLRGRTAPPAGARLVEVNVAGAATLAPALQPGAMVDVLITTGRGQAPARSYLALQRVELADYSSGSEGTGGDDPAAGSGTATLRVSLRQAVMLTAAQSFARELRLVPRAEGDRRVSGPVLVSERDL